MFFDLLSSSKYVFDNRASDWVETKQHVLIKKNISKQRESTKLQGIAIILLFMVLIQIILGKTYGTCK